MSDDDLAYANYDCDAPGVEAAPNVHYCRPCVLRASLYMCIKYRRYIYVIICMRNI